ncbi:MAG: MarR family transcriptional regulator [Microbacteriaceae bacterium]|nr:MarR family transcriptional regulator [Microbacteriaceae bacterium]MCL2793840.1 MarR family transcriptional regulator [Microbacteriaceae bacterium]
MDNEVRAPQALRHLVSWQAGRLATIGARLTAQRLPLEARSDFAVLASLVEYGDLSQADLGRILGLDRNNVNGIVTRLDTNGHVTRRADPGDRRRNIVSVTDAGRTRLTELQRASSAVQAELLDGLTAAEQARLVELLDLVLARHPAQPA